MSTTMTEARVEAVRIVENEVGALLEREWLLTNRRGSYASSTLIGCNTRRYHGLLVASMRPPVQRLVTLSNVLATVQTGGGRYDLGNLEFSDRIHPQGYRLLKRFRREDGGVHYDYELGEAGTATKSIYLAYDRDVTVIVYSFRGLKGPVTVRLTPMLAMRDFHSLQSSSAAMSIDNQGEVVTVHGVDNHGPSLHMRCAGGAFERGTDWWYAVRYRQETRRGQHDFEDVWVPGSFTAGLGGDGEIVLTAQATSGWERPDMTIDAGAVLADLRKHREELAAKAKLADDAERELVLSADQFVVRRKMNESSDSTSILAGYHWFADWGRDTFVSLPGLLLSTGRYSEALEVLHTFGASLDMGQVPNRFDDYGGSAHYNSVDASLWYVNAAWGYLQTSGDRASFAGLLWPVLSAITAAYMTGTRDNIHADDDGLIVAGDAQTQLTWMDAKCNGVAFTPRYGKAVEVNALWINALRIMAETSREGSLKRAYTELANQASESFNRLFWNEANGCLNDCVGPDGTADAGIRPNQIFAVSLPFSCLDESRSQSVVAVVEKELLTPYGLRSLSPRDSRYRGHYEGDQFQRDGAYHQGTVWGYLIGPFVEAYLKVNGYSAESRDRATKLIEPMLDHMNRGGCVGSVSEIFDGDWPHYPRGCVAQAWSVAELLRCKQLIRRSGVPEKA